MVVDLSVVGGASGFHVNGGERMYGKGRSEQSGVSGASLRGSPTVNGQSADRKG